MIQPGAESPTRSRWPNVTTQIFIGLVLGIVVGYVWPGFAVSIRPLADAFLRMIKMIVAPLLFSTLVIGIAGAGDLKSLGRIGLKAIIYFEVATTVALAIGLALVNIFKPGAGLAVPLGGDTAALAAMAQNQQHAWDLFLHAFPTSIVDAMARGDILQVVVFATFFGVGVAALGPKGKPVYDLLEATALAMFKVTGYVMACAPIGVFAAIGATVGGKGLAVLVTLGKLVALMYLGLALFVLIVVVGRVVHHPRAVPDIPRGDSRAVPDRVLDRQFRSGAAEGARSHGTVRRAEAHRRRSCCPPATASTSMAPRCTCRSRACSSPSWQVSISASVVS